MDKIVETIPKITVLMPVYNCELYIKEAVDSVLNQTYTDFEFLIIDDASTDKTVSIIKSYNDSRIQLIEKPINSGYTISLNMGLELAKGKYIARMDGDDISFSERFAKQVAFLEMNPEVVLCGAFYQVIGTDKVCNHPLTHDEIKVKLITGCYIAHPTVMMRTSIFTMHSIEYNQNMEPAEDYDLWSRLVFLGKVANLGEVLLHYRLHSQQVSKLRWQRQSEMARQIRTQMLQKLIPEMEIEFLLFNYSKSFFENGTLVAELRKRLLLFDKLVKENNRQKIYSVTLFNELIKTKKIILCKSIIQNYDIKTINIFKNLLFRVPVFFLYIGFIGNLKFFYKCVLNRN